MATIQQSVNVFTDFANEVLREAWLPGMNEVTWRQLNSFFLPRIRRSSEGITNLVVNIPFKVNEGIGWRKVTRHGYTPSAAPIRFASQNFQLGCAAATAMVSHELLMATSLTRNVMTDLLNDRLEALQRAFPYYLRMLLWTSQNGYKAMGRQAGAAVGNVVTLDNDGLWHTGLKDRTKLFEPGQILQIYSAGGDKLGEPVQVVDVDHNAGTITLDDASDTTDNALFVAADIGGLDIPYMDEFPGLLDVIDDDNTFQGVDRSQAANSWARAKVVDATDEDFGYLLLSDFFAKLYNPSEAFTHGDVIRKYFLDNFREQRQYTANGTFKDGYQYVEIDNTRLVAEPTCDRDKVFVPDFDNLTIADLGFQNLFEKGWQQIQGRTFVEYTMVWWGRLYSKVCTRMGVLTNVDITGGEEA